MLGLQKDIGSRQVGNAALVALKDSERGQQLALNPPEPCPLRIEHRRLQRIGWCVLIQERRVDIANQPFVCSDCSSSSGYGGGKVAELNPNELREKLIHELTALQERLCIFGNLGAPAVQGFKNFAFWNVRSISKL